MTYAQIAKALGVSEATVGYWKKQGCPVKSSLAEIRKWRDVYDAANPRKQSAGLDPQLLQAKKLKLIAETKSEQHRARLAELKVQQLEGKLVPIDDARELVVALAERARTKAQNSTRSWAKKFVGLANVKAAEAKLDELVREITASLQSAVEEV